MVCQILSESILQQGLVIALVKLHVRQLGGKSGVAAVVAPIGVQHADFRHAGVALLLVVEIELDMLEVGKGHSQAQRVVEPLQLGLAHLFEAIKNHHIGGLVIVLHQRLGLGGVGHAAVHGVHAVLHHGLALLLGEGAANDICGGRADDGLLGRTEQADALLGRVGPLVELTGQILHRKDKVALLLGETLLVNIIHRRLREDRHLGLFKSLVREIFNIVAHQHANVLHVDAQIGRHLLFQLLCLDGKGSFLFHKYSSNHIFLFFNF